MSSTNFEVLLEAVEFVESRDRGYGRTVESEHGYASSLPMPEDFRKRNNKAKKAQGNRSTHNELEKNRRAHLRHCLERLKNVVPVGPDASRHTQLGLLTKAKLHIKGLEDKDRRQRAVKDQLERENRFLHRKLSKIMQGHYRIRVERSISECSTSTNSTTSSLSSGASESAESEDVDILGDVSNSDDDNTSIQSIGSDGGLSVTNKLRGQFSEL